MSESELATTENNLQPNIKQEPVENFVYEIQLNNEFDEFRDETEEDKSPNFNEHLTNIKQEFDEFPDETEEEEKSPDFNEHFTNIKQELDECLINETVKRKKQTNLNSSIKSNVSSMSIQPTNLTKLNDECEVIVTDRGTMKLILDGYTHVKNTVNKKINTHYWQCTEKLLNKCHGSAATVVKEDANGICKHFLKKVRRIHNHDPELQNTKGFAKIYNALQKSRSMQNKLSECKFIINRLGNAKLALDGYFYNKHKCKGQDKIFYWKCEKKRICSGYATTYQNDDGSHSLRDPPKLHNHLPTSIDLSKMEFCTNPNFTERHDLKRNYFGDKCNIISSPTGSPNKLPLNNEMYIEFKNIDNIFYWKCMYNEGGGSCLSQAKTELINGIHYLKGAETEHNHKQSDTVHTNELQTKSVNRIPQQDCSSANFDNECHLSVTLKGFPKLIRNGFYYNKRRDTDGLFYWKCEKRGECNGSITTILKNDDTHEYVKTNREHNHSNYEPMKKEIEMWKNLKKKTKIFKIKIEKPENETEFIEILDDDEINTEKEEIIVDENHEYYNIIRQYTNQDEHLNNKMITESDIENGSILCEFIPSAKDNPKLCINSYLYNKNRIGKDGRQYWCCEEKASSSCSGCAVSVCREDGKDYLKKIFQHNHPPNIKRKIVCEILGKIREKCAVEADLKIIKIVDEEMNKLPKKISSLLPPRSAILSMARRKRSNSSTNSSKSKKNKIQNVSFKIDKTLQDFIESEKAKMETLSNVSVSSKNSDDDDDTKSPIVIEEIPDIFIKTENNVNMELIDEN